MVFIAIFVFFTFLAGKFIDKLGPKIVMMVAVSLSDSDGCSPNSLIA